MTEFVRKRGKTQGKHNTKRNQNGTVHGNVMVEERKGKQTKGTRKLNCTVMVEGGAEIIQFLAALAVLPIGRFIRKS